MQTFIRNSYPYRLLALFRNYLAWGKRQFYAPSPHFIKQACIVRNGFDNATWVETGTYLGQTTQLLAKYGKKVYSIEPEPTLFKNATKYFETYKNVEIVNGVSEQVFPEILPKINGNINFWLDGHYSGGVTFQGAQDTPILEELKSISSNMPHFDKICVLVDDIRCFHPNEHQFATYPSVDLLVDWARENHLNWHIEHDIFVAKN